MISLAARVRAVRDPQLDVAFPRQWPSWVRITLYDGRVHETAVSHPRGDPENFPTPSELDAKFRSLAARVLPDTAVARVSAAIDVFGEASSIASLMAAAVPPAD